jgi:plasmid stabilization system protein ParE
MVPEGPGTGPAYPSHRTADRTLEEDTEREEPVMPQRAWSDKRERQYEHIKEGLEDRGRSEDVAEEIAARTVNKERARHGEARESSRTSTQDISSGRRGGLRSHRGPGGRTYDQLYAEARDKGIKGRSKMNKAQLERAVGR